MVSTNIPRLLKYVKGQLIIEVAPQIPYARSCEAWAETMRASKCRSRIKSEVRVFVIKSNYEPEKTAFLDLGH